jgi:dTMP kinase
MFITFEGIDFCGKSTQVKLLSDFLQGKNKTVKIIREPGGTEISEKIREILLDKDNHVMNYKTELLLFAASRAQLINEKIISYLKNGYYVIADRLHDSSIAYQGYGRGIEIDFVKHLQDFVLSGVSPDITFFLDITLEESEKRKRKIGKENLDRIELSKKLFYEKVRNGYIELTKEYERIKRIDGALDSIKVHEKILEEITSLELKLGGVKE